MNKDENKHDIAPEEKRDTTNDKKKIKKIAVIVLAAFLVIGALYGALYGPRFPCGSVT